MREDSRSSQILTHVIVATMSPRTPHYEYVQLVSITELLESLDCFMCQEWESSGLTKSLCAGAEGE